MSGIGRGTVNFSLSDIGSMVRDTERESDGKKSKDQPRGYGEYLVKVHGRVEKIYPDSSRTFVFYQSTKPEDWCVGRGGVCALCREQEEVSRREQKPNIISTPQSILTLLPLREGFGISTKYGKQLKGRAKPSWEVYADAVWPAGATLGFWEPYTMNHSYNDEPAVTLFGKNGDVLVKMWYNKGVAARKESGPQTIKYDDKGRIKEVIWRTNKGYINRKPSKKALNTWLNSEEAKGITTADRRSLVKNIKALQFRRVCKTALGNRPGLKKFNKRELGKILSNIFEYL